MTDFVLELRSEEIPARMQARGVEQLVARFGEGVRVAALPVDHIAGFVTPRRLIVFARGVGAAGDAVTEERRGPRADAPAGAIAGFLKSTGLTRDALEERDTPKGRFLYATITAPGRPAQAILAALIPAIVRDFDWPKSMRWGAASRSPASPRWVRPLSGIVALLGDAVVPCEAAGLTSGRTTFGHRFMTDGPLEIESAATYAAQLRAAYVLIDPTERARLIDDGARAAASAAGLTLIDDAGLVAENAGLTEWPVPLLGHFDPAFLDVPREVIQLTMRTNQKYFAATDAAGKLAPAFVCVANLAAADGGAGIVAGNRKVLAARLADAKFFWDADRAITLEARLPKLADIVFHEKLGTVADKVGRVAKLARWLVESGAVKPIPPSLPPSLSREGPGVGASAASSAPAPNPSLATEHLADLAEQAARLCKADLVSATVGEFPELQGLAGGYLAASEGLDPQVAAAIRDHYKPVGQGDEVPTAPVTVAVALADKLDTLERFFAIEEMPTGSRDPFALRRSVIGLLRLMVTNKITESAPALVIQAAVFNKPDDRSFEDLMPSGWGRKIFRLNGFFEDRFQQMLSDLGYRKELIRAFFVEGDQNLRPTDMLARVRALQAFLHTPDGDNLLAGYKRAANILRIEEAKGDDFAGAVDPARLVEPAEHALATALDTAIPQVTRTVAAEDFVGAMAALARVRPAVDAFFDGVTVNAPDPALRTNRLNLLARLRTAVHSVADFSKVEG